MYCSACGRKLETTALFCPDCGKADKQEIWDNNIKQLTCKMCGGPNLIKRDGVFVCQNCGTKYSVEEARKMIVEGPVDVSGSTVKVDTSGELINLYQIARRAKDDNNGENATKYYDMILVKDPTSWEASFYVVYFKAIGYKIEQYQSADAAGASVVNCLNSVLKLIKDHVGGKEEQIKAVQEVALRCTIISSMLYNEAKNYYNSLDIEIRHMYNKETVCMTAADILFTLGNSVDLLFSDYEELRSVVVSAWKDGIAKDCGLVNSQWSHNPMKYIIDEYVTKVQKYDSSYQAPTPIFTSTYAYTPQTNTASGGGCYVATTVYGSYDCPQVWTLRRYRDYTLAETWYGRVFIRIYYIISPTLVKWFGHTSWFKKMWKSKLDRIVANLWANGYENTPYEDRNW